MDSQEDRSICPPPRRDSEMSGPAFWLVSIHETHPFTAHALTAVICLTASFLNFVNYNDYPLLRIEILYCVLILTAAAALFGLISRLMTPRERFLWTILLVVTAVELNIGGGIPIFAITVAVALLMGRFLQPVASIIFFVVVALQLVDGLGSSSAATAPIKASGTNQKLVLLHVILDGAIGIEGFPEDIPGASETARWGRDLLVRNGFAVFGRAYSEHRHTTNSVPWMLGFGADGDVVRDGYRFTLRQSRYMTALVESGFEITIYENRVGRYCNARQHARCWKANGHRALDHHAFSRAQKAFLLMRSFASLASVIKFAALVYAYVLAQWPAAADIMPRLNWPDGQFQVPFEGLEPLDQLKSHISLATDGEAYFAHVLLPHSPYALDPTCRVKPMSEWTSRFSLLVKREDAYRAYMDQWRCAVGRIETFVRSLRASRPDESFVILVHGDHGSRIAQIDAWADSDNEPKPQDYRDIYSTLVAVKAPGIAAGYRTEVVSIQDFLADLVAAKFRGPFNPRQKRTQSVVLTRRGDLTPVKRVTVPRLFNRP